MRKAFACVMGLVAVLAWRGGAAAAEIKVLSTGNMTSILAELTGEFERTTGHKLSIQYGSTTRIKSRIEADEAADLTINEKFVLDDLLHQARIANGTIVGIARSPLAIGVRAGAPSRTSARSTPSSAPCWRPKASHTPIPAAAPRTEPISSTS
jgi:ABC-type molybdate transport system substrate-binding protein